MELQRLRFRSSDGTGNRWLRKQGRLRHRKKAESKVCPTPHAISSQLSVRPNRTAETNRPRPVPMYRICECVAGHLRIYTALRGD
jgi:hypothetical protein